MTTLNQQTDTTNTLGQATGSQPELLVVPQKLMKKKGGKGMLIGILLFFILTLPVAIYYGFQQYTQITESRSKAVAPTTRSCYSTLASCQSACKPGGAKMYICRTDNHSCIQTTDSYTDINTCIANVRAYITYPNTDTCYTSQASCQSACQPGATPTTGPRATNTPTRRHDATNTPTRHPRETNTPTTSPYATETPVPTEVPTDTPTNTPTTYYTPAPGQCDASCESDSNCESGLSCYSVTGVNRCRKDACPDRSNCECPLAEATPTTRYYQPGQPTERVIYQPGQPTERIVRVIAEAPIATATQQPTPKVPVAGFFDAKAIVITVGSILLLMLGLIL